MDISLYKKMCYKWQDNLFKMVLVMWRKSNFTFLPITFLTSLFISYFLTVNYLFIYK